MASSSSSADAHSTNKPHKVFINHRRVDEQTTFARSLYLRVREKGLTAFLDDKEMEEGSEISSQLEHAIRNARVHVAVFSPRYAESEWCLKELRLMLQSGAPIIPIFYGVIPGIVRWNTKGLYDEALQTHEKKGQHDTNTIQAWRNALHQVANNSGFQLEEYNGQDLVLELLDKVVESLLKMVPKEDLYGVDYPTGLHYKLTDFDETVLLKQQQSGKPQILGIVGLGGVGKTTLAKEFFDKKKSEYDKCCFLSDVRHHATNRDLHVLQSQLLNSLIGCNKQIYSVDAGKAMLKEPLRSCKALIILDDVDDVNQVKAFLPQSDALNSGTLFLITSRDMDVLRSSKVENSSIYSLSGLNKEHSLVLFCFHAFSQPFPLPEFRSLVDKFVNYCNGLPLSLKVFGALLYGKEISQWEDEWKSLRQIVPSAIQETFKISYNSLNQEEKDMFLDIACFLVFLNRDTVIGIWNASGWRGNRGFLNLQNKCLVELDARNLIRMHELLIDMGRQVSASSLPRRLCRTKDVIYSLSHPSYEITFRGIRAVDGEYSGEDDDDEEYDEYECVQKILKTRASLRKLQILQMQGSFLEPILEPILTTVEPPSLSLVTWIGCPHSSLPSWVSVKNLRVLQLFHCELNTLWESQVPLQFPVSLEELWVMHCPKLKTIPGWAQARKLRALVVSGCSELEELPSMETLASLEILLAEGCKKLKDIRWSAHATKLRVLHVSDCSELEELPRMETLASLEELWAEGCKKLKCIRGSAQATKLKSLHVSDCSELKELPSMETLASLEDLQAQKCTKLKGIRWSAQATKLKVLDVSECSELEELPSTETLASLKVLRAARCTKLKGIRGSAQAMKLQALDVSDCSELEEMPSMETLASLEVLVAARCTKLKGIRGSAQATKLKALDVSDCSELEELPNMETLASLEVLDAMGCKKLKCIRGSAQATKLKMLNVSDCSELEKLPSMETLPSLEELLASGCVKLKGIRGSAPATKLKCLNVCYCSELEELPSMEILPSLEKLGAYGCKKLKGIRGSAQATKLKTLFVCNCSELEELPSMETLASLEILHADRCVKLRSIWGLTQATNLRQLIVYSCSELEVMEGVEHCTWLERLNVSGCHKLVCPVWE